MILRQKTKTVHLLVVLILTVVALCLLYVTLIALPACGCRLEPLMVTPTSGIP